MALFFVEKTMSLLTRTGYTFRMTSRNAVKIRKVAAILSRRDTPRRFCFFSVLEIITHAPFGDDKVGLGGVELQLLPQAADVHVHRARVALIVIAPDEIQQGLAAVDAAGVAHKQLDELIFAAGQLDRLRKNENVNVYTLNTLCRILDCELRDVAEYRPDEENE